ncbi:MAG TPA: PPC domain-containing protein [Longimicrobiaceae bacterium]|nr:PPC domain-containing protein [Longimicrobiaceae bacterium]
MNAKQHGAAALAAACLLGAAAPAAAGQGVGQQPLIRVGQTVNARLTARDPSQSERGHFKVYRFNGTEGQRLIVTMRSQDFDAFLTVGRMVGGILDPMKTDDDHGGDKDARLRFRVPAAGTYLIVAQALAQEDTGAFTLQLENSPEPATATRQPLTPGQAVTGSLSATDAVLEEDETYYDLWTLRGRQGQRLEIVMRSGEFDTYLSFGQMQGDELNASESDDDSGGGDGPGQSATDSRIRVTLPEDGEYVIRANSIGSGATGSYTLVVTERAASGPAVPRPIEAGQEVQGSLEESDPQLEDDSYYDYWTYQGDEGETLRITMSSEDFDTFLAIGRMEGDEFTELQSNDDGDDGTNSLIEITLPGPGTYVIRANSLSGEQTGSYRLKVDSSRRAERN